MDTIVAISTPPGKGGIGIVRMSGPNSLAYTKEIFRSTSPLSPRKMTYGHIWDGDQKIDEVMACYFRAPKTYTREDMVEIYCHGGYVTSLVIFELLISIGARPAEAGEFTKLAFLNGRINLLEAEAVEGIIEAQNREEQQLYVGVLGGVLTKKIDHLSQQLVELVAECEAKIDYPELGDVESMGMRLDSLLSSIEHLLEDEARTNYVREGIKTAIIGRPNVGKSSLLNALTNKERAIVTEIPGTTRDTIEEFISLDGVYLHLVDTAGIRSTDETIEKHGIALSRQAAEDADLILLVLDGSMEITEDDLEILDMVRHKKTIPLINKEDRGIVMDVEFLQREYGLIPLLLSVKEDRGVRELVSYIKKEVLPSTDATPVSVFKARHREALYTAKEALQEAKKDMDHMPFEIVEVNLRVALDALHSILGRDSSEDIIDRVFRDFCVGK